MSHWGTQQLTLAEAIGQVEFVPQFGRAEVFAEVGEALFEGV